MSLFYRENPFKSRDVRNKSTVFIIENVNTWTCGMCGNEFPITIKPHLIYEGNDDAPVNAVCNSCDQLRDEGP